MDLGCGNGRFFEILKDKDIDYIGVDNSEKLIEIAKNKYPKAKFQVADALNLPFPKNFFDKIYSIAVLHHIPSEALRLKFLRQAKRVLRPKGLLILTVWNLRSHPKRKCGSNDIIIPFAGLPKCYFHCFTKKELEGLIGKVELNIKKSDQIIVSREKSPNSNFYIVAEKPL